MVLSFVYLTVYASHSKHNLSASTIIVGTYIGHIHKSSVIFKAFPPHLPEKLFMGHTFPALSNSLVGIGPFCNAKCKVLFSKESVTVFFHVGDAILAGLHELYGVWLW